MYSNKNWKTIKGKKFGKNKNNINIEQIYINIEKVIQFNENILKNEITIGDDKLCLGTIIFE